MISRRHVAGKSILLGQIVRMAPIDNRHDDGSRRLLELDRFRDVEPRVVATMIHLSDEPVYKSSLFDMFRLNNQAANGI